MITITPEEWRYRTQLATAVHEHDYDVAHGRAVTGPELDHQERLCHFGRWGGGLLTRQPSRQEGDL